MPSSPPSHPASLNLTPAQEQAVLRAVTTMLRETVCGAAVTPLPSEIAALPVSGTFVSLKRKKHLRGCCGGLQPKPTTLGAVIPDAVHRTVFDDPRFPPVSPAELPYLDVEVWLLFNPQQVEAKGAARPKSVVTGGKHGVIIRWQDQRGLLLPGVAEEHGWDSETFLDHVCLKAGMHPSRWSEDETQLLTFEGNAIRGPVGGDVQEDAYRFLSPEQIAAYTRFCRENLAALLWGGTPRYSAPGLPDGTVSGLVLSIDPGTGEAPRQASRIDLSRGMALQASLFQLTQAFAPALSQSGVADGDLARLSLTILYDPVMHGGMEGPDLRGIDPARRALLLLERGRSSLVFNTQQKADDSLQNAAQRLAVRDPQATAIFSLAADTAETRVEHTVIPQPNLGVAVRPPAMAGKFYPGDPNALRALVDELLGPEQQTKSWPAAMVPHAGLRYSGAVAGSVLRRLKIPKTVIVIGPKHTPYGVDWAVSPSQEWSIPGARIASDPELAERLVKAIPGLELDALAHQQEHGIEVELPFLARLAPQARVVGIALGQASFAECQQFAEGLAKVVRVLTEPPLLLVSSDMNHFASDAATRRLDELALECMDRKDAQGLFDTCRKKHVTMCGMIPAVIVMETLKRLGKLNRVERVAYATTADTTGDLSRVVGYAGVVMG